MVPTKYSLFHWKIVVLKSNKYLLINQYKVIKETIIVCGPKIQVLNINARFQTSDNFIVAFVKKNQWVKV